MIALTTRQISDIVKGELHCAGGILVTKEPVFDSREVQSGSIFLALKGDFQDGHDFAKSAVDQGAAVVLASRVVEAPCIVVPDVLVALGALAHYVRQHLPNLKVIGITGSQGKTTTKDLLAWILRLQAETVATHASFNNELGAPLTLLRCTETTQYCILEMGARHVGDIKALCEIAEPDIGVVLEVGRAHVGEFGSVQAVAETKAELVNNLREGGTAILGRYDEFTPKMAEGIKVPVLTFGQTHEAQIRATDIDIREGRAHFDLVTPQGREAVALRLVGAHQIPNALAAAAVCTALHIPIDVIAGGLSTAELQSKWRMELHEVADLLIINDAYNANPESTAAALRTLSFFAQERGGQSWAFLGRMRELGETQADEHAHVGRLAQSLGIDNLVCIGAPEYARDLSKDGDTALHFYDTKADALEISDYFSPGDVVLVKASRAERLEELVTTLIEKWEQRMSGSQ
ncbi:MAG TPA: UDP-N-acetylmuramoyl-tripeptide--D-alanyl-D-alanine ligase [Candidatus Nanopelagicaceae bacterium]|jgi:UDP-N-acetylmuramoyl-tripeptide--D-alanyl-D-alanine ligase